MLYGSVSTHKQLNMDPPQDFPAIPTYAATLPAVLNREVEEIFAQYPNDLFTKQVGQHEAKQQHLEIHNQHLLEGQKKLLQELEGLITEK